MEFAVDVAPLAWPDQTAVAVLNTVDGAIQFFFPESQELLEPGKVWCQVIFLPDKALDEEFLSLAWAMATYFFLLHCFCSCT